MAACAEDLGPVPGIPGAAGPHRMAGDQLCAPLHRQSWDTRRGFAHAPCHGHFCPLGFSGTNKPLGTDVVKLLCRKTRWDLSVSGATKCKYPAGDGMCGFGVEKL